MVKGNKYALLIGTGVYEDDGLNNFSGVSDEIDALNLILSDKDIGGFKNTYPVVNPTSRDDVMDEIVKFTNGKKQDDLLLFYYSGHGLKEGRDLYLSVSSTEANKPSQRTIPCEFIHSELSKSESTKIIVILDCCYSGGFGPDIDTKGGDQQSIYNDDTIAIDAEGYYVLAASDESEAAYAVKGKSIFTEALIEGIREGKAAPESKYISIDNIYKYAREKLVANNFPAPYKKEFGSYNDLYIAVNPDYGFNDRNIANLVAAMDTNTSPSHRIGAAYRLAVIANNSNDNFLKHKIIKKISERVNDILEDGEEKNPEAKECIKHLLETFSEEHERAGGSSDPDVVKMTRILYGALGVLVVICSMLVFQILLPIENS